MALDVPVWFFGAVQSSFLFIITAAEMTVSKYEKVSRELLLAALTVGFSLLTGLVTMPCYKNSAKTSQYSKI
jgi:hypothetical protein